VWATGVQAAVAEPAAAAQRRPEAASRAASSTQAGDRLALVEVQPRARGDSAVANAVAAAAAEEEEEDEELSELEDEEAALYLHTPEEAQLKEMIWTELNKDFLERQSAKAAALESAAAKVPARSPSTAKCKALPGPPRLSVAWTPIFTSRTGKRSSSSG